MPVSQFKVGMLVRPATNEIASQTDPDNPDGLIGRVVVVTDSNGDDIHVEWPRTGVGIYRPDELVILALS
jgi:hypothetical protein